MNFRFLLLSFILIFSCSISAQNSNKISNSTLIKKLKNYELNSHNEFQIKLNKISESYLANQSSEFIKEELGLFRIWGEAFRFWQSDFKKKNRWKPRVEKYYKTTNYQKKIQEEINVYTRTIYEQRVGLIKTTAQKQVISVTSIENFHIDTELIENVVNSVEDLAINEVVSEIGEYSVGFLIIWIIVFFAGAVSKNKGCVISLIVTLAFSGYNIYKSICIENSLEKRLIEFTKFDPNNLKIDVKPSLIINTNDFYYDIEN